MELPGLIDLIGIAEVVVDAVTEERAVGAERRQCGREACLHGGVAGAVPGRSAGRTVRLCADPNPLARRRSVADLVGRKALEVRSVHRVVHDEAVVDAVDCRATAERVLLLVDPPYE